MLTRVDRLQIATLDAAAVADRWAEVLGAEPAGTDEVGALGARRVRCRLGDGYVEFLEPDGPGPVTEALQERGATHLFAAGVAGDVDELVLRLVERGEKVAVEGGQAFISPEATGGHGLRLVASADETLPPVGAISFLYEVTNLVADASAVAHTYADLFGLHPSSFVPIASDHFGYGGSLALFDPEHLHRIEVVAPDDPDKTMGRFFARFGESLYMAFAECPDLSGVAARCRSLDVPHSTVEDHTLFLHPAALGGVMLGLSRPTYAWTWSGHPERVR